MPDRMIPKWENGTMVLPAPMEVDYLMRSVPKGKVTTINVSALGKCIGGTDCFQVRTRSLK